MRCATLLGLIAPQPYGDGDVVNMGRSASIHR